MMRWVIPVLTLLLAGCGGYRLDGFVAPGAASGVEFRKVGEVTRPPLGVEGATYELSLDPRSLGRRVVARGDVSPDGSFSIPIDEPGTGFLEYEFELVVRAKGYDSAVGDFRLPPKGTRVVVTLAPGRDRYREPDDPMRDLERFPGD